MLYDRILDALSITKEKAVQTTAKVKNASVQASYAVTDTIKTSSVRLATKTKTFTRISGKTLLQGFGAMLVTLLLVPLTLVKAVLAPVVIVYAIIYAIIDSKGCLQREEVFQDTYTRILVKFLDWGFY